ncbi:hypothetical protein C0416_00590 [bacterium]|nr:hypothetical protein [bacterium]
MAFPDDKTLYDMFEEQGRQMLPKSLAPHFADDIHDLVRVTKDLMGDAFSKNPYLNIDIKKQVVSQIESWKTSKERHLAYKKYLNYVAGNKLTNKILSFSYFIDPQHYKKWQKIEELGLQKGSKIRVKGYGDEYTVRGITEYLTIAVDEITDKYFSPDQIL